MRKFRYSFLLLLFILICNIQTAYAASPYPLFDSVDEAASYTKESLLSHKESICFRLTIEDPAFDSSNVEDCSTQLNELSPVILRQALSHDPENPCAGDYICNNIPSDPARIFYIPSTEDHVLCIGYEFTYYTTLDQEAEVSQSVSEILNTINQTKHSQPEMVRAVYDYVCSHVNYSDPVTDISHTAYSAVHDGHAVCQGYASLLYRLLLESGINCRIIEGQKGNVAHAWNIVELNGKWYTLDATADAGKKSYQYLLRCGSSYNNDNLTGRIRDRIYDTSSFYENYPMGTHQSLVTIEKASVSQSAQKDGRIKEICTICGSTFKSTAISSPEWVQLSRNTFTYNGSAKKPSITVFDSKGQIIPSQNYSLSYSQNVNASNAALVKITFRGDYYTGSLSENFSILKANNVLKIKPQNVTLRYKKVKAGKRKVSLIKSISSKTAPVYTLKKVSKSKYQKYFSINTESGRITVRKGTPKGIYSLTVKVTAPKSKNYKAKSTTFTARITIK